MKRREFLYSSTGFLVLSLLAGRQLLAQPGIQDMNGEPKYNLEMVYDALAALK
jgi:hypothetical protein